jgi:hypothetical protein
MGILLPHCLSCDHNLDILRAASQGCAMWRNSRMGIEGWRFGFGLWLRAVLEFVGALGAVLGGFEIFKYFFHDETARSLLAQIYVLATTIILGTVLAWREIFYSRKEKYANIVGYVQQASQVIMELHTLIQERAPASDCPDRERKDFSELFRSRVALALDQLNLCFVSLTGTHCRTSIKMTYDIGGEPYYYTLARDQGSQQKWRDMDNRRIDCNHDPLRKNAQYARLLDGSNSVWHYFCNDLTNEEDFLSSSFSAYDVKWGETGAASSKGIFRKGRKWPLPYRSTIVSTIRQSPGSFVSTQKTLVLGFVTVDSESRGVFVERWDVPLVNALADALYHPLKMFLEIQNRVNRLDCVQPQTSYMELPKPAPIKAVSAE